MLKLITSLILRNMKRNNKDAVSSKSSSSLSQFKIETKPKLRSSNRLKREHIKIEYDSNSENSSKIKEEPLSDSNKKVTTKVLQKKLKKEPQELNTAEIENDLPNSVEIKKEICEAEFITENNENVKAELNEEKIDVKNIKIKKKLKLDEKPYNWEKILENLREMRKNFDAPVDSMGCDKCMDDSAEPKVSRCFLVLIRS